MNWDSVEAFVHMGGYGGYVWGSFVVTFGAMALDALAAVRRRRRAEAGVPS